MRISQTVIVMGEIVVFSKKGCGHCRQAKGILQQLEIPFREIDVGSDLKNGMLMSRLSGRHTVPQIFFNNRHIGGARELSSLDEAVIRKQAAAALNEPESPELRAHRFSDEELRLAVIPIKEIIDPHVPDDPTALPEYGAVRVWYGGMFGFLCNLYDQMSLKPEAMALWMSVLASAMVVVERRIGSHFGTACYATALKAGCSYCSAHGADLSMKYAGEAAEHFKALTGYLLHGEGTLQELPFTPELQVAINLASKMTEKEIDRQDMEHARSIYGVDGLREACFSVGAMGIIMGFLNRFNDLVGVEIEASIKHSIDSSELGAMWNWGTHDTEDDANRRDCADGQTDSDATDLASLIAAVKEGVFDSVADILPKYAAFPDERLPAWIASLPDQDTTRSLGALYHSLFSTGELKKEIKHLSAYALALGSGHESIAREEKRIMLEMASDKAAAERSLACAARYAASADAGELGSLTVAEQLALKLAKCSDHFPHIVRGELVQQLDRNYTATQIIELIMALAVIGMAQRWLAVYEPLNAYVLDPTAGVTPEKTGSAARA